MDLSDVLGEVRIFIFRNLNRISFYYCFTSQLNHHPNLLHFPWRPLALVHTQNQLESIEAWGRTQTQWRKVQDCVWQLLHLGLSIGSHTATVVWHRFRLQQRTLSADATLLLLLSFALHTLVLRRNRTAKKKVICDIKS